MNLNLPNRSKFFYSKLKLIIFLKSKYIFNFIDYFREMPLPLFGKSHKSPPDIVKNLKESLAIIEKGDKKSDKAAEEVNRWLQSVKGIIYGQEGQEPHTEQVIFFLIFLI